MPNPQPLPFNTVALLSALPRQSLARGQVGTVVERLDEQNSLVEFSDDQGTAFAIAACQDSDLLVLHYHPQAA